MESNKLQIAVCAPDGAIRERIYEVLLQAGHDIVSTADSPERLVEPAREADAQLIVLAATSKRFALAPEIAMLRARLGEIPIVIVASARASRSAKRLVFAEADGLVHETNLDTTLPATVQCVVADQVCIPSSARSALARPVFSHREKQVLELVLAGLTNGEIAGRLFLSESTVKSHLASSFRKLGVSSRSEVAKQLSEDGYEVTRLAASFEPAAPTSVLT